MEILGFIFYSKLEEKICKYLCIAFLESLYVFLMEEMHSALNATIIQNAPPKPEAIASVREVRNAAEFAEKMGNLEEAEALWCELLVRDEGSRSD